MSSRCGGPKAGKPTINCHRLPLDGHQFDPDAFVTKDPNANNQLNPSTQSGSRFMEKRLTTPQLVSALAGVWNLVGQSESSGTAQIPESHGILHKDDPVCFSRERKEHALVSSCAENSTGLSSENILATPKSIFEDLSLVKRTLMLTSCRSMAGASSTWRHMHVGGAYYLQHQNIYPMQARMMHANAVFGNTEFKEDQQFGRDNNHSSQTRNMPTELCTSSSEEAIAHMCESSLHSTKFILGMNPEYCSSSSCSAQQMMAGEESRIIPADQISSNTCTLIEDSACTSCPLGDAVVVNSEHVDQDVDGFMSQKHSVDNYSPHSESSIQHWFYSAVTLNRHAVAGALAGTVVSVSLHPIDTVKTIIQVNSSGRSSFYHTLRHTLVERGVLGLYGGLASKIACSAPISAIYTLTYEIVKGFLLPILPKDYCSIAHCAAGGCSSIATSFIFTPSECIKQQMQVGSQYHNCWDALLGCIRRGGITSLYAGWGAVLCRNVPHSVVKFYTYESLKQCMLKSAPANSNLDSGQTLFCGGFAGSTAALFTTPFDVVKTRVQLQALCPVSKYEGVLPALKEIFQREGFQGLYRGLAPRLAMYISQGAIFFTSYEFLKTIMFSEQEVPTRSF
uniref:Uncharacterized protein n=1 Tax=Leersia perrieri TaxID=77586 RepID=A0A0D9VJ76_9ORYZ